MLYDLKNVQVVWRGQTLNGFSSQKINISQSANPSMNLITGIFGEYFNCPNPGRFWTINSSFLANSESYRILERDNLLRRSGTLIIRDLNLGTSDVFYDCFISSIGSKNDAKERIVSWTCARRNAL